jgi:hypothetical protein
MGNKITLSINAFCSPLATEFLQYFGRSEFLEHPNRHL